MVRRSSSLLVLEALQPWAQGAPGTLVLRRDMTVCAVVRGRAWPERARIDRAIVESLGVVGGE